MKKYSLAIVLVLFVFCIPFVFTEIASSYKEPFNILENPLPSLVLTVFFMVLITLAGTLIMALNKVQQLENEKAGIVPETAKSSFATWWNQLMQRWTKAKSIEQESEIILDHNYDGIKELDNTLPPWWVYMFYATIIFAAVYLIRFEVLDGDTPEMEYNKAVAEAKASLEKYKETATDLIDASTVTLLTDAKDLSRGKAVFNLNCAACHLADGGGSIGPNLTDEYWILGGGIKNVYTTISEGGRDGKGMVSWKKTLKPQDMAKVASYVLSLQGTTPAAGKKAEGELWVEE